MLRRQVLAMLASTASAQFRPVSIGCQTSAWKIEPARLESSIAAWRAIQKLGYHGVETSFRNLEPHVAKSEQIRGEFKSLGLILFGVHIQLEKYDAESGLPPSTLIQKTAKLAAACGAERLILSGSPAKSLGTKAKVLLETADLCRGLKIGLAYHNHSAEFSGTNPEWPRLIEQTKGVAYLLDATLAFRAGHDPAQLVTRFHRSIGSIQLRGLGKNEINYAPMVVALKNVRWRGWTIAAEEREADVEPARRQLKRLFGV